TFLDAFVNRAYGFTDNHIAGSFLDDRQRLQDWHAAADQSSECPCETRDGHLADDRAEQRHVELEFVEQASSEFCLEQETKDNSPDNEPGQHVKEMIGDGVTDRKHEQGEGRH